MRSLGKIRAFIGYLHASLLTAALDRAYTGNKNSFLLLLSTVLQVQTGSGLWIRIKNFKKIFEHILVKLISTLVTGTVPIYRDQHLHFLDKDCTILYDSADNPPTPTPPMITCFGNHSCRFDGSYLKGLGHEMSIFVHGSVLSVHAHMVLHFYTA